MQVSVRRGCPQEGVLSLLLWDFFIDELLANLHNVGYYTQEYTDYIAIFIIEIQALFQTYCKEL